ncbi:MAG: rane protein [Marmoricola sp.]|nr:rane protein [Marmoricola sp.]
MGFLAFSEPPVEPAEYFRKPFLERMRILTTDWVENGFGTPRYIHLIYIVKMLGLYLALGLFLISRTSDLGSLWHFKDWWDEPIVYQKLLAWTMFLEAFGLAGTWGPLCGHFKPMTGAVTYWVRPGTIRLPPWPGKVPLTQGDSRTVLDVVLYLGLLAALLTAFLLPGVDNGSIPAGVHATGGLVRPEALFTVIGLAVVLGLRDKVIFLAARSEQYLPAMFFCATLGFTDMVIALKMTIVMVWLGAGVSKFGNHFVNVVPTMVANGPFVPLKAISRAHFRHAPDDLRPSKLAWFMAHVGGTTVELLIPLTLLLTTNTTVALLGAIAMVTFHVFITSLFPLAVPLEWNIFYAFAAVFLFVGFDAADGYAVGDFSHGWMFPVIAVALLFFPVLGNLRPDLVSFLPSMRQYAGNWASATWVMGPGIEERLNELPKPAPNQTDQLVAMGYDADFSEIMIQKAMAWRAMHSQGRGLYSVITREFGDDVERYTLREAEFVCNTLVGWNFGDGHLHDEGLINAVQKRLQFAPGELVVVYVESQPIHKKTQDYRIIDAAVGVVERGTWLVSDAVAEQPWLPNGPIPLEVTWRMPGYVRVPAADTVAP